MSAKRALVVLAAALASSLPSGLLAGDFFVRDLDFGVKLMRHTLFTSKNTGNILFSPTSVATALAMLSVGAKGKSKNELLSVLKHYPPGPTDPDPVLEVYKCYLGDTQPPNVTLETANAIIVDKTIPLIDRYKDDIREAFGAKLQSVDFLENPSEAISDINDWVKRKTKGKISEIFNDTLSRDTLIALISAIYFKSPWQFSFDRNLTVPGVFYNKGTKPVSVEMMTGLFNLKVFSLHEMKGRAFELPYAGGRYSMILILPWNKNGLHHALRLVRAPRLLFLPTLFEPSKVLVMLPKFKLSTEYDFVPDLKKMGIRSVFGPEADLSGISDRRGIQVTTVKHRAMVEVSEEGTFAATTPSINARLSSESHHQSYMDVDRPFLFYIWDNATRRALFFGAVNEL